MVWENADGTVWCSRPVMNTNPWVERVEHFVLSRTLKCSSWPSSQWWRLRSHVSVISKVSYVATVRDKLMLKRNKAQSSRLTVVRAIQRHSSKLVKCVTLLQFVWNYSSVTHRKAFRYEHTNTWRFILERIGCHVMDYDAPCVASFIH